MINILVALPCEAGPVASAFGLRRQGPGPYPVYAGDGLRLVVSGVGKTAAAAAAAYAHRAWGGAAGAAWLNLGIAGHPARALGEGVLAHSIEDAATARRAYPDLAFAPPCASDALVTVDRPEPDYPRAALYDMEAWGFFTTAARFAAAGLVQCYKIVSDNRLVPATAVSRRGVQALVEDRLGQIARLIEELAALQRARRQATAPAAGGAE